jgi:hypothetical protein
MAKLDFSFDASKVDTTDEFAPIPKGKYAVEIIESVVKETQKGGQMLRLTARVIEGEFENRRIWTNINFRNPNPVAETIGIKTMAQLSNACGITGGFDDTEELHFKPIMAEVTVEVDKNGQYSDRNSIRSFSPYGDTPKAAAPKAANANTGSKRPWEK